MAVREKLQAFVRDSLSRGLSRSRLEEVLLEAGWDQREVKAALGDFAEIDFSRSRSSPSAGISGEERGGKGRRGCSMSRSNLTTKARRA